MGLISRVSSRTYREQNHQKKNMDKNGILGLATDPAFLQQVGILRMAKDPEDTELLKFATGVNVASKIYKALTPQNKAENNGRKPSDAVLERICREEFGCVNTVATK